MFGSKKKKNENLVATGEKGVGTVVRVRDTGMTVNDNPRVALTFRVQPLDGSAAFETTTTKTVSRVTIPQAGQRYPTWYDAADPSSFVYAFAEDVPGRVALATLFGPEAFGADGSGIGQVAVPTGSGAPISPVTERIRELDALKAAGVVDDAEYAEQKTRILQTL